MRGFWRQVVMHQARNVTKHEWEGAHVRQATTLASLENVLGGAMRGVTG